MVYRLRYTGLSTVLVVSLLVTGCVTRAHRYVLEVNGGGSIEENKIKANEFVTKRLDWLKQQLKTRYPELTDSDLARFGIRWDETYTTTNGVRDNGVVTMTVVMQDTSNVNVPAVVATAAQLMDSDVNGAINSKFIPAGK